MCTFPPVCGWDYDNDHGVAYWVCTTPAPEPRGWGNMCPRQHTIFGLILFECVMGALLIVSCTCACYKSYKKVKHDRSAEKPEQGIALHSLRAAHPM